ncbi:hypothetical protein B0H14DRAFT_2627750 [Mycena olivaceomarginata]|nr:hypothetical protein B0H14DRAFT_2627750 [Mycena olivaceomarginata]
MTPDEMESAGEEWPWEPTGTVWVDDDVSSDVYVPAEPFRVTQNCRVQRIERVSGVPSQMPVPRVPTAYIISFSSVRDTYKDEDGETMNLELILKDKDCHSWDSTLGERQTGRAPSVNVKLFAGVGVFEKVLCRRARQTCQGLYACDCVESSLLDVERYELDPHAGHAINSAQIQQRLTRGTVIQDKGICFVNSVKKMKCTGKDSSGKPCDGYQVLKKATQISHVTGSPRRPISLFFVQQSLTGLANSHGDLHFSRRRRESMCSVFSRRICRHRKCRQGEGTSTCSRIIGSGSGKKGKQLCLVSEFPHLKDSVVRGGHGTFTQPGQIQEDIE